jgi:hypothetical protein
MINIKAEAILSALSTCKIGLIVEGTYNLAVSFCAVFGLLQWQGFELVIILIVDRKQR